MEPRTFELMVAPGADVATPGHGLLAAFAPPAEHELPVVALACDPRHDPGKPITDFVRPLVTFIAADLGLPAADLLWACIDNYGRFFEVIPREDGLAGVERFETGVSVEAFFKVAGATGEAVIELLSSVLEAPRATDVTPTEAEFLDRIEAHSSLPAPGMIFQKVSAAAEEGDAKAIAHCIQPDPVLSSSLINSANAARFAASAKTGSVQQAVTRLGTQFVKRIVFVAEMMSRYKKGNCITFDYHAYWLNAIANGAAMRGLMEEYEIAPRYADEAFTAGLVAGIGWLVIAETYPDLMMQYIERCWSDGPHGAQADPVTKMRAYREVFPCPINLVSERYLERFEFPDTIRQAIVGRDPELRNWFDALARATRVANSLSPFVCNMVPTTIPVPEACQLEWQQWRSMIQ